MQTVVDIPEICVMMALRTTERRQQMTRVKTVRDLIVALQQMDQDAVILVTPWTGSTIAELCNDTVCVDYVNEEIWPVRGVLISN
jgi:hypothetical protein